MLSPPLQGAKLLPFIFRHDLIRSLSVSFPVSQFYGKNPQKFEAFRSARMITKLMTGSKRAARKIDHSDPSKLLQDFGFMQKKTTGVSGRKLSSGRHTRRTGMLNNLFVEQITSLLATGEVAPDFLGLGIQISKVKVTPDFSAVNVYWYATGTETDDTIEKLLANSSGHLRHELCALRVIGVVPPIHFFKDRTFSKLQEIETLLSKSSLEQTANTNLNQNTCDNEESLKPAESTEEERKVAQINVDPTTLIMSNDVLGVKHDRIMNEIKRALERKSEKKRAQERNLTRAAGTTITDTEDSVNICVNDQDVIDAVEEQAVDHRKRQTEFLKYLKKQQAEKDKHLKSQSVQAYDKEFHSSIREERITNQLRSQLEEMDDFNDNKDNSDDDFKDDRFDDEQEVYYKNLRENFK